MRVGFCCLWEQDIETPKLENQRTTTARFLATLSEKARIDKLQHLVDANVASLAASINHLCTFPASRRMFRIGGDLFPLFTHPTARELYESNAVKLPIDQLRHIGTQARANDVRLSFHPGQYTILQSANPGVVERGVAEFEYHARIAELLGYTGWHDSGFVINIHMGGKAKDCSAFRSIFQSLSPTAQNLITIENDEFTWGAEQLVDEVGDLCPIVLDLHHHAIFSGQHLSPTDPLVESIKLTWRGHRPKLHVAMSKEALIGEHVDASVEIDYPKLIGAGFSKSNLRQHSNTAWHKPTIDHWLSFAPDFDLMFEGKLKNIGQRAIFEHAMW